jgi:predicted  nucleic acid-binding Zn-ribbon protein
MSNPLAPVIVALGARRARALAYRERRAAERVLRELRHEQLEQAANSDHTALERLLGSAAQELRQIDRSRSQAVSDHHASTQRLADTIGRRKPRAWHGPKRRRDLDHEIDELRSRMAHSEDTLARLDEREVEITSFHRHANRRPNGHSQHAASAAAARLELNLRHELAVAAAGQRAVRDEPEHIREAIGERPAPDAVHRSRWDALAADLERHRMEYGLDPAYGPLGLAWSIGDEQKLRRKFDMYAADDYGDPGAQEIELFLICRDLDALARAGNLDVYNQRRRALAASVREYRTDQGLVGWVRGLDEAPGFDGQPVGRSSRGHNTGCG